MSEVDKILNILINNQIQITDNNEIINISLPNSFNELCIMFDEIFKFSNILCVRYSTCGPFLDTLFLNKSNVSRIIYEINNIEHPKCDKGQNILIQLSDLKNILNTLNKNLI
jgi:hypothetical protein